MDTIECMRTFVAVAAQESFTGGARQLGISTKLASKYIARLEKRLDVQLFNRTTRSVSLTDTGQAYLQRCGPWLDQLDEMESVIQARHGELAGPIRLTAPTGFGSRELVRALRPFQEAHPKVQMDMHLSDQHVAIIDEGFDLAIRFGALQDSSLVARKLMDMRIVVVASPEYLRTHGAPTSPQDLADHNCLMQLTTSEPNIWRFQIDGEITTIRVKGAFRANSPRAIVHMAEGGMGIGRCPHYTALPFLQSGALELLFETQESTASTLYAVYPPSRHLTARIRALIDHLADWFSDSGGYS